MNKRAGWLAALAALAVWVPVLRAQTDEEPPAEPQAAEADPAVATEVTPGDEAARAGRGERPPGERIAQGGAGRSRNVVLLEAFREETKRVLQVDEETGGLIDEVFKGHIDEVQAGSGDAGEDRRDQANEMRDLVSELREAQRDGDRERVEELRSKITALRSNQTEEPSVALDELQGEMREILDDEQFERFVGIQRKYEARFARSKNSSEQNMQRIRQALARIELSPEQQERTRELFVDHARSVRKSRNDEDKAAESVKSLREAILGELDEHQIAEFERQYAELEQRAGVAAHRGGQPTQPLVNPATPPADDEAQTAEEQAEQGEEVPAEGVQPPE